MFTTRKEFEDWLQCRIKSVNWHPVVHKSVAESPGGDFVQVATVIRRNPGIDFIYQCIDEGRYITQDDLDDVLLFYREYEGVIPRMNEWS